MLQLFLELTPGQDNIAKIKSSLTNLDFAYIASLNRAYNEIVWPAIEAGKIVIIPSSELGLLRYAFEKEKGNPSILKKEIDALLSGTITHKLFAGNRILINVTAREELKMLDARGEKSILDPKNLLEAKNMVDSQNKMSKFVREIPTDKSANFIEIDNVFVKSKLVQTYIENLVTKDIFPNLKYE